MERLRRSLAVAVLAAASGLAACSAEAPYIHSPELINREHEYFAKERTDRGVFTICYASWETEPKAVRDLAIEECGRYGKRVALVEATLHVCPLNAPNGVRYACLGENEILVDGEIELRDGRRRGRRGSAPAPAPSGDPGAPDWAPATDTLR